MDEIDFGFINKDGFTIYRNCFDSYAGARFILKKPKEKWSKLVPKVEETFFLVGRTRSKETWN